MLHTQLADILLARTRSTPSRSAILSQVPMAPWKQNNQMVMHEGIKST